MNLNQSHAVYNAPLLPGRPRAGSSRPGGGALRGRFGLRAWTARALRNLGGPRRPGAAIRRSAASMQFTKLRSGLTWPPFRALLRPTAPTPMPAPTPDRRRHVPKSESFLHQLRDRAGIVSCRSSAGEVPLWGPQTGTPTLTKVRECAGHRHSTGSVTAAAGATFKMNLFCIRIKSESFCIICEIVR